jgi:23S rRNA pseudouridine1911/1915/1917 synthase
MEELFKVIYEDGDILALNKPSDLACHPTKGDVYSSLISRLRLYLGPGAEAHMINRLDRETSGVLLVGKCREAAAELRRIWERREVFKTYLAIVHGWPASDSGVISAALGKDEKSELAIKDCVRPDGAEARTDFQVLKRFLKQLPGASTSPGTDEENPAPARRFSLMEVVAATGRKHQIRIHLQHAGHSIVGDKMYGGDEDLYLALVQHRLTPEQRAKLILPCQALHARELRFTWREREFVFQAEPERWFAEFHSVDAGEALPPPSMNRVASD